MRHITLAVLFALGLGGCTVGQDYVRPEVEMPQNWRVSHAQAADVANTRWWQQFNDPALNTLVDDALRENLDIRIAAERVEQFIGALTATRSQLYPQLGYGGDMSRNRASRLGQPPIPNGVDNYFSLNQMALSAAWQLDLFGRVQRLSEAAQAQVYASEQAQRGVVLSLVSSVAVSYIALRALDAQLEIAKAAEANFSATERLFKLRFKSGLVSNLEVMQVTSQAQQARAAIPALQQAIAAQENLISLLLGRPSAAIARGKSIDQLVAPLIPEGLPADLLQRRPDILQAEQNLVAANANVGATRALYYPNISLTGALGSVSTVFASLLTDPATTWQVAAGITGPIFTFGGIEGQVASAEAQQRQAELVYRQTILNALRETNDALSGAENKVNEVEMQRQRVDALRESARLSRLRFDKGLADYLEVLVAENELFAAELAGVRVQSERFAQIINVYQAVGGGWVDEALKASKAEASGDAVADLSGGKS
ncbi:MAG: efflux transporter outer membrane subunit [Pseudomonadota bacterium]